MPHFRKTNFNGDSNIGMYAVATDSFCLVGSTVPQKEIEKMQEVLKVPIYKLRIYGTPFIGIFVSATSEKILVPKIIFDEELAEFKKVKEAKVKVIETKNTALRNNILCNDSIAILSEEFSKKEKSQIKKELNVKKIISMKSFNPAVPGSSGILTNQGGIVNPATDEKEIKKLEKETNLEIGRGTVNMGSPFLGAGIIANSNGFLVGSISSGIEMGRIDESLGFLK